MSGPEQGKDAVAVETSGWEPEVHADAGASATGNGEAEDGTATADQSSAARELLHSAAYSAIAAPSLGLTQIVDKAFDTNFKENTANWFEKRGLSAPEPHDFGSGRWAASTAGSAVGMLLPFGVTRYGLQKAGVLGNSAGIAARTPFGLTVKDAAITGFTYDALMIPTKDDGNFLLDRFKGGVGGALTFGTLAASSMGLRSLTAPKLGEVTATAGSSTLKKALSNSIVSSSLAGVPAGLVNAQYNAMAHEGKLVAPWQQYAESAATMSLIGGMFGAGHTLRENIARRPTAETEPDRQPRVEEAAPPERAPDTVSTVAANRDIATIIKDAKNHEGNNFNALVLERALSSGSFRGKALPDEINKLESNLLTGLQQSGDRRTLELVEESLSARGPAAKDTVEALRLGLKPAYAEPLSKILGESASGNKGADILLESEARLATKMGNQLGPVSISLRLEESLRKRGTGADSALSALHNGLPAQYVEPFSRALSRTVKTGKQEDNQITTDEARLLDWLNKSPDSSFKQQYIDAISNRSDNSRAIIEAVARGLPAEYAPTLSRALERVPGRNEAANGDNVSVGELETIRALKEAGELSLERNTRASLSERGPISAAVVEAQARGLPPQDAGKTSEQFGNALKEAGFSEQLSIFDAAQAGKFLSLWQRLPRENDQTGARGNSDKADPQIIKRLATPEFEAVGHLSPDRIQAIHDFARATGQLPPLRDKQSLEQAADIWKIEPTINMPDALEFTAAPPSRKLSEIVAWQKALSEFEGKTFAGQWANGQPPDAVQARHQYWRSRLLDAEPSAVLNYADNPRLLPLAIEAVHGKNLSTRDQRALSTAVKGSPEPFHAVNQINPHLFSKTLSSLSQSETLTWEPKAAAGLTLILGPRAPQWLKTQQDLGRDAHDASIWLPVNARGDLRTLRQFLLNNPDRNIAELETITNRWVNLDKEQRKGTFDEVLARARDLKYDNVQSRPFAEEASKWGISAERYREFEQRFLESKDLPVPFPLEKSWRSGEMTGRFIPRDDPRGLFLGNYTECCQHPNGTGFASAWYGQTHPKSGFFVVEDATGRVVAQSWVWLSRDGKPVFDSIEGKGLDRPEIEPHVRGIYESTARELARDFGTVTVGVGRQHLNLDKYNDAHDQIQLFPEGIKVYTDAANQRILAEGDT